MMKSCYGVTVVQKRGPELAKKKAEIFLITVLQISESGTRLRLSRTVGYYFDLKEAIDGLLGQCAVDDRLDTHAVIEVFPPGIRQAASKEHWFANDGQRWRPCEKPASEERVNNYGIG